MYVVVYVSYITTATLSVIMDIDAKQQSLTANTTSFANKVSYGEMNKYVKYGFIITKVNNDFNS